MTPHADTAPIPDTCVPLNHAQCSLREEAFSQRNVGFTFTMLEEVSPWSEHWAWFKPRCDKIMTPHADTAPIPDTCVPL
eukprot:CAMPEP_0202853328 /NCGR_PEP_ID=MMETSP1389-20130828/90423_1 /ASSEMBLY_ACC=CAM_ASM_000865 /TAXON_ID=302021 /ORGANISM="Rhodomonas sp., Strain CCMP768" /LENGTH=78 /DNA_ID=CAMNT_0049531877 /DNA_START=354 /DNA_END=591 /DNA_ORIENTATION=+